MIGIILIIIGFYILIRNDLIIDFRAEMITRNKRDKLPNYFKMLFSFKPINEKQWIKED